MILLYRKYIILQISYQYQNTENNPRLKITMSSWQNHLHQDMALSTVSTSVIDKLEQVLHVIHPYLD